MIDLFQNPFSGFNFQSTRQATGIVDKSIIRTGVQSSSLIASSWDIVDEYIPSSSTSSSTYKPSSGHAVPLVDEESVQSGVVTDKMREEMKSGDSYWTAMGLLPVATPIFNEIFNRALEEKGIDPVDFNQGYCSGFTINPDGIFMFAPDESGSKVDPSYAKEVCLALESAFNSSSLNMNENPHLFTKDFLPPDYEPEKWGRTVNREEWSVDREPDFSMFVEELRSDIVNSRV